MTVANGQTMANKTIFTCPACKKVVSARVLVEFEFDEVEDSKLRRKTSRSGRPRLRGGLMNARKVRRARRIIAREACPAKWGIRHRWAFDGYFWHRCVNCGEVS